MSADEWLDMARALCAQHAPNRRNLIDAMTALENVVRAELRHELRAQEGLDSVLALLDSGGHDGGADDVRLLFAASKAVPRHLTLWARASHSRAFEQAVAALLEPCARADAMYKKKVLVSQMAVMQPRLQYTCHRFWQALARHGTMALGAQETANTWHAYATLASQPQGALMRKTGNSPRTQSVLQAPDADRLHDVLWAAAEQEAPRMNPQGVANTLWALAKLNMRPTGSLREVLWAAAERVAPSMNPQEVANTLLSLSKLDMPPTGSLHKVLWAAAERVAPSMNPQNVANTVSALAKLDMPPTRNLREVLLAAVERVATSMNPLEVANTMSALASLDMPPTGSLREMLWAAAERVAPSMNPKEVTKTLWALAKLDMPPTDNLRQVLWAQGHARVW
jgi:hypothetical protein